MKKIILLVLTVILIANPAFALSVDDKKNKNQDTILGNLNNLNITVELAQDKDKLKKIIEEKKPNSIFIEEWVINEGNEKILKDLKKASKKHNSKLFLVIGKNSWLGDKGVTETKKSLDKYEKNIDGIVLRIQPDKTNIWQKGVVGIVNYEAEVLNLMLDSYQKISEETKKRKLKFLAEFPFWLTDYKGPLRSFSEDACRFADKVVFLIDDKNKLDELEIPWNDISCNYYINLAKRATQQDNAGTENLYSEILEHNTFKPNFHGFIIDVDSTIFNKKLSTSKT